MRVTQIIAGAEYGGAETFFVRLVIALHRTGVNQQVFIRHHPQRAEILRLNGLEPIEAKFGGALDFKTPRLLEREVKKFSPDIVLSWMNRASNMAPVGDFLRVGRLGGYYDLKYYKKCDHLIGNTENITEYLVGEGWPAEKIHYLPNFVTQAAASSTPRQAFFTPETVPLILSLGRLHINKGFDVLLQALTRVPNAYLWIAGEGPLRGELEQMAEKLAVKPRVRFLGWRDDVASLLQAADVFVCPSRHEPLGNVILEAWAHNVPVVAADSYGPGLLIEHLVSGILVPIDDPITLAKSIRSVIEDNQLGAELAEKGLAAFRSQFTEKVVVERYLKFFQDILS